MSALSGRCLCGQVSYRAEGDPLLVANCHCGDCQRQTAAAFSTIVGVPREGFVVEGELSEYVTVGDDTGLAVRRQFCGNCGSPIVSLAEVMPEAAFIKAGTLDDRSWIVPEVDMWCDSAQPWVAMDDEARGQFPRSVPIEF